jgi:hypothetical protein
MPKRRHQTKRQRRRAREAQHDLREHYREGDLPFQNGIGVLTIEDPYSEASRVDHEGDVDVRARLEQARHNDGTIAEGGPGWTPPKRPLVTVITALRDDALGRMYARRQIDQPQYLAGRAYQETADQATVGSIRSIDFSKTLVSGGALPDILTDSRKRAMKRLRQVEERVAHPGQATHRIAMKPSKPSEALDPRLATGGLLFRPRSPASDSIDDPAADAGA